MLAPNYLIAIVFSATWGILSTAVSGEFKYLAFFLFVAAIIASLPSLYHSAHKFTESAFCVTTMFWIALSAIVWGIYFLVARDTAGTGIFIFGNVGDEYNYFRYITEGQSLSLGYKGIDDSLYEAYPAFLSLVTFDGEIVWLAYAFNLMLFAIGVLALYGCLKSIAGTRLARTATAVYTLYPEHYNWIFSFYKDSLLASLVCISLYLFTKRRSWLWILIVLVLIAQIRAVVALALIGAYLLVQRWNIKNTIILVTGFAGLISIYLVVYPEIIDYFEFFLNADRISYLQEKLSEKLPIPLWLVAAGIPLIVLLGLMLVLIQPVPYFSETSNIYDNLWRQLTPAGLLWFNFAPYFFLQLNKEGVDLRLLRGYVLLSVVSIFAGFLFLTLRHRYAIIPALLPLATIGMVIYSESKVRSISKVTFLSLVYFVIGSFIIFLINFRTSG